ncbi:class I glutamine amidotransferase-like protein [Mycotypha africana]|uniref:class I glutamine amidotransferase-like protein n=1 Tax=Mycotypha africana TaxID=64632 RepID=UPI0023008264|nr:class I glutamine amidotransferase-like protein [Mycotypha africana]KAI8992191.1 class I glutamine amidotransferase-like protein [Mycotypha africana]
MTKTQLRLGLLINDTPLPQVVEKAGDYRQQFRDLYDKAAEDKQIKVTWEHFDVVDKQEYPSLDDIKNGKYDALILTGSASDAHGNDPWILKEVDFIKTLLSEEYADKIKLVGICFGHQIILRAAGGKTGPNEAGWETGFIHTMLNEEGQKFFNTKKDHLNLYQFHRDHVSILPEGFIPLGFTTDHTPYQITVSKNGQCITSQGHPEFSHDTMYTMLTVRKEKGVLKEDYANKCIERLENSSNEHMDDIFFTKKVIDFITN